MLAVVRASLNRDITAERAATDALLSAMDVPSPSATAGMPDNDEDPIYSEA
jgi:hypothetical protein